MPKFILDPCVEDALPPPDPPDQRIQQKLENFMTAVA
jgi:hypothetical protein